MTNQLGEYEPTSLLNEMDDNILDESAADEAVIL